MADAVKHLTLFLSLLALPVHAHRLVIYAYAENGEVVVESKFDNGTPPRIGQIEVRDSTDAVLFTMPIDPSGETRFMLDGRFKDGVVVDLRTDEGHTDYWVLTPDDVKAGMASE